MKVNESERTMSDVALETFAEDAINALDNWIERQAELFSDGDTSALDFNECSHADGEVVWLYIENVMSARRNISRISLEIQS